MVGVFIDSYVRIDIWREMRESIGWDLGSLERRKHYVQVGTSSDKQSTYATRDPPSRLFLNCY